MSIPPGSVRIVLSGRLPGGEEWSTGFWITEAPPFSQAQATALAALMRDTLASADGSGAMRITMETLAGGQTYWDRVTAYVYETGSPIATYQGEAAVVPPVQGGRELVMPNQVAMVLSLRTSLPGRRHRGRMFLPASGTTFGINGQTAAGPIQVVATAWALAFTDINASTEGKIVVVSTVGTTATQVTSVIMDSRADIQRRRANQETIQYRSTVAVTP